MYFVYQLYLADIIVPCVGRSGSRDTYVGIAKDVYARLQKHNGGSVAATRGRQWYVRAILRCRDLAQATIVERWLKCGDTRLKRLKMSIHIDCQHMVKPAIAQELIDAAELWKLSRGFRLARRILREQKG